MTECLVFFKTKLSAKSKKDLERKAEQVELALSKCLKKRVYAHGYVELVKQDTLKVEEKGAD